MCECSNVFDVIDLEEELRVMNWESLINLADITIASIKSERSRLVLLELLERYANLVEDGGGSSD